MEFSRLDRSDVERVVDAVATNLLAVLVVLFVADSGLGVDLPLDLVHLAAVAAAGFGLAAVLSWSVDGRVGSVQTPETDGRIGTGRRTVAALCVLLLAGTGLRFYALGAQSFWFDEAITANAALGLIEHGKPMFPSGYVYWRGFPHTVLVAASMATLGVSEWAARLPAVVFGILTVLVTYLLGRAVGGRRVGLVAAALVTFLTWEIAWSRQARMYQQLQFFYTLTLYGLARLDGHALWDRRTLGVVLVGVVGAGTTHQIGLVLVPVAAFVLSLRVWRGPSTTDIGRKRVAVVAGGLLVVVGALEMLSVGLVAVVQRVLATGTGVAHLDRYLSWLQAEFGLLFFLAVVGLGLAYRRSLVVGLLLTLSMLPPLWVLSYRTPLFASRYLYFVVPVGVVACALTVHAVGQRLQAIELSPWDADARRGVASGLGVVTDGVPSSVPVVGLLVVVLLTTPTALTVTTTTTYSLGPNAPQPDFAGAYEYVNERADDDDVVVVGWTAPALYYHGEVEYWLAHSLTNERPTSAWTVESGRERYSGATPVHNATQLRRVVCAGSGWIVLDDISVKKLSPSERSVLTDQSRHRDVAYGMNVYSWEAHETCPR